MKKPGKREERTRNGPSGREKREENKQCRADGKKRAITNRTGVVGLDEATCSPLFALIMLTTVSLVIGTQKMTGSNAICCFPEATGSPYSLHISVSMIRTSH